MTLTQSISTLFSTYRIAVNHTSDGTRILTILPIEWSWSGKHYITENVHVMFTIVELNNESVKVCLHMKLKKTQLVINKYIQNRDVVIKIGNEVIEHIHNYVYLGKCFNNQFQGRRDQESC